jgi:hypothetical protein
MNTSSPIRSFIKRLRYGAINPARDWRVLITLSAIALAGIIIWNAWAFDTVASGGVIGSVTTSSQPVFNSTSLDSIQTMFSNRATEEEKYETGTYRFADPSQ